MIYIEVLTERIMKQSATAKFFQFIALSLLLSLHISYSLSLLLFLMRTLKSTNFFYTEYQNHILYEKDNQIKNKLFHQTFIYVNVIVFTYPITVYLMKHIPRKNISIDIMYKYLSIFDINLV